MGERADLVLAIGPRHLDREVAVGDLHHRGLDAVERADDAARHQHEAEPRERQRTRQQRELQPQVPFRRRHLGAGALRTGRERGLGEIRDGAETPHRLGAPVVRRDLRRLAGHQLGERPITQGVEVGRKIAGLGSVDRRRQGRRQGRGGTHLLDQFPARLDAADQAHMLEALGLGQLLLRHDAVGQDDREVSTGRAHQPRGIAHGQHLIDERIAVFGHGDERVADVVEHGQEVGRDRLVFLGQAGAPLALLLDEIGGAFLRQPLDRLRVLVELGDDRVRHVGPAQERNRRGQRGQLRLADFRDLGQLLGLVDPVEIERPYREGAVEPQIVHGAERLGGGLRDPFEAVRGAEAAPRVPGADRQHGDQKRYHDGDDGLEEDVRGDAAEHEALAFWYPRIECPPCTHRDGLPS